MLVLVVALTWAVLPALPALLDGQIVGQPFTDLYPSVWAMGVVADAWPRLPTHIGWLGAPDGIGFYASSPLHAWFGAPLTWLFGAATAYDVTLLAARAATVVCAYGLFAARPRSRSLHPDHVPLGLAGALSATMVYAASPFFQGYAVEGIVEGTDGWTLVLWAWMVLTERRGWAVLAFALTVASSWYLGMVACLVALGWGVRSRTAWWSMLGGLVLAAPLVWSFVHAFGGSTPLPDDIRAAMGAPAPGRPPGIEPGLNPFALSTWVGLTTLLLALPSAGRNPVLLVGAALCGLLSTGRGPWWHLPVLEMVRFPYRWHAGTLLLLAPLVGQTVDRLRWRWLGALPFLEGLLLSPIEPVLPGAPADVPALYQEVKGPILLEIPGPVAMPPGVVNRSRPRARYLLYAQLSHHAASPWVPDFNGVSAARNAPWLDGFASWDPLLRTTPTALDLAAARTAGVTQVMVHRDELAGNAVRFEAELVDGGATLVAEDGDLALYGI